MDFTFQQLTKLIGTLQECTLHLGKEECRENTAVGPVLSIGHNWQTLVSLTIIGLLVQNFVLTFVWSQITILNNSAIQNWKQNSEWIGYFRQQQQTETEMMSFSQLLSTSQINCHKGSEVALAPPPPLVRAGAVRWSVKGCLSLIALVICCWTFDGLLISESSTVRLGGTQRGDH